MSLQVDDVTTLQNYLAGVIRRADHHGENVKNVVLPLVRTIVLFKDPAHNIKVFTREGSTANVMRVYIGETQYAFSYDPPSQSIVLKRGNTHGEILASFTNATTIPEILQVFASL